MWLQIRRQLARHKTKLDEWLYLLIEQSVVDLIDIREVINRPALLVFIVDAVLIVQNGVEAHVFEARVLARCLQVQPIAFAHAEIRPPRAKHLFPEVGKGMRRSMGIDRHNFFCGGGLCSRPHARHAEQNQEPFHDLLEAERAKALQRKPRSGWYDNGL